MSEGARLDPEDWAAFRSAFHELLDQCLDRLQQARDHPWTPPPGDFAARIQPSGKGAPPRRVFDRMASEILPFGTGNTHPRFWGWVHGTGLPVSVAAELVAATMNANLGGRFHGANLVERGVINWLGGIAGFAQGHSGILTSGTSQATLIALSVARAKACSGVRQSGIASLAPMRVYIAEGGHSCVAKALEIMGHGSDCLFQVATDQSGAMDLNALKLAIDLDHAEGVQPLAIVGTAGSVNTGAFDDLAGIAQIAHDRGIWFHVDAAFGFWVTLAGPPWASLIDGLAEADSVATDFHKWIGVPYDCGACLIADERAHRSAFAARPDYLAGEEQGLAGGEPWFCDYGIELSRGFRALKVWAAIECLGTETLGAAISDNCRQAAQMADLVEASEWLDLAHQVISNVCCFFPKRGDASALAASLQLSGEAVFSTTKIDGRSCLRAAIVNHRTTEADVREAIAAVEREVRSCSGS